MRYKEIKFGKTVSFLLDTIYGYKVGKHELLPFPEHEMRVNPNLKQNPGW